MPTVKYSDFDLSKLAFTTPEENKVIPEIKEPQDTEWIKHIKMKSELLSEFWGRDMYLGAHVLLPKGFNEHPEAKYPLMVFQGHFPSDFKFSKALSVCSIPF